METENGMYCMWVLQDGVEDDLEHYINTGVRDLKTGDPETTDRKTGGLRILSLKGFAARSCCARNVTCVNVPIQKLMAVSFKDAVRLKDTIHMQQIVLFY